MNLVTTRPGPVPTPWVPLAMRSLRALGILGLGAVLTATGRADGPASDGPTAEAAPRLAAAPADSARARSPRAEVGDRNAAAIAEALGAIADCRSRFARVEDYRCTLVKRERVDGRLTSPHIMQMKVRARPFSVYLKFQTPTPGREAIYVAGRNAGRILAHDVGWGKLLAGTMHLDPRGSFAMEDCRHPITEAGIGHLIDTVAERWAAELSPGEAIVSIRDDYRVDGRTCTRIESVHSRKRADFLFHRVDLYIDHELGLPIRFEAYDWPEAPGLVPPLVEEYTYKALRINTGLTDRDFDPSNELYSFGRF